MIEISILKSSLKFFTVHILYTSYPRCYTLV
nr:MAG TPA: hypothetical protein [Bacteriophage sp.]